MQTFFNSISSTFKQIFSRTLIIFALMIFLSLSNTLIFSHPSSYATTLEELKLIPPEYKPTGEEKINRAYEYSEGVGIKEEERQEAYEQAVKDGENLNTIEKVYERNLKAEQAENPQPNIIEKAEKVIEKVTGK